MPSAPKAERREADFYETPEWCTRALMEFLFHYIEGYNIIEPCAGHGAISKIIKEYHPECTMIQYELNRNKKLQKYGDVTFGDFFKNSVYDESIDAVITNPPFTYSLEFIDTCRKNYPLADVTMLLPLSFLGSQKRNLWWKKNKPNRMIYLSDRPSFTGDGKTDSSVYAWYQWYEKAHAPIFQTPVSLIIGAV